MHLRFLSVLFALAAVPVLAQAVAHQPPSGLPTDASGLGFQYVLPDDWQIVPARKTSATEQKKEEGQAPDAEVKKGIGCLQVMLTARHGIPPTVIVVDALPFACYGQTLADGDLPGFGAGAAEGLKQAFDISDPIEASYTIADHKMWIERARALPKGKTAPQYTVEIACTLLHKGVVCWMAQAADEAGLNVFEQSAVTLDGTPAPALVPPETFLHLH